jgi:hypothetical protein
VKAAGEQAQKAIAALRTAVTTPRNPQVAALIPDAASIGP